MSDLEKQPDSPQGEQKAMLRVEQRFAGPLPPPELLRQYEQILPGAAERIFQHAEREQAHRQHEESLDGQHLRDLDRASLRTYAWLQGLGLAAAFLVALLMLGGGIFLIHEGRDASGLALIAADLAAIVAAFAYREKRRKDERTTAAP